MQKPKIIAIVGPTASGKTTLGIELAWHVGGEVISADSRQVYRGLDIGTGKVTPAETRDIPHHLIDIIDVQETYTATDFARDAATAISDIGARGHVPIIVGGTFFYLDVLRGRRSPAPTPPNPTFRAELERVTTPELLGRLAAVAPARAATIDPHNRRRLIRALEIHASLGHIPNTTNTSPDSPYEWLIIGLNVSADVLRANFQRRATDWITRGLLEESTWLLAQVGATRLAEFGFEYQLAEELRTNTIDQSTFLKKFEQKNWQYAKRQLTWLKRDDAIEWFTPDQTEAIYQRVANFLTS